MIEEGQSKRSSSLSVGSRDLRQSRDCVSEVRRCHYTVLQQKPWLNAKSNSQSRARPVPRENLFAQCCKKAVRYVHLHMSQAELNVNRITASSFFGYFSLDPSPQPGSNASSTCSRRYSACALLRSHPTIYKYENDSSHTYCSCDRR